MTDINKQRFLPELSKLLTFMVEEDRQTALAMYSRLFDDAADEQQLMDLLVSPTRQAVVIARSYDAKERRRQLEAAGRGEAEETPAFVMTLDQIYQQVAPAYPSYAREEEYFSRPEEETQVVNQFSLFEDDAHPIGDEEYVPFQFEAEAVPLEEEVETLPVEPEFPRESAHAEAEPPQEPELPEEDGEVPQAQPVFPSAEAPEEPEPLPTEPEPDMTPIVLPEHNSPAPAPASRPAPMTLEAQELDLDYIPETRQKPRVFLMILYLLIAIPVTLAGVVLLLIPTILVLALAVLVIVAGAGLLVTAFSGFSALADILIVLGGAIIVLALGLLLLWLFVWFLGGAIGGLIGGMLRLCRKWCYVEVPV